MTTRFSLRFALIGAAGLMLAASAAAEPAASFPSAQQIVRDWRHDVHAPSGRDRTAHTRYRLLENALEGTVDEWVTQDGAYRQAWDRRLDRHDTQLTATGAQMRDWNGFLRDLNGVEAARLRAEAFNAQTLAFGPNAAFESAAVGETDDHTGVTLTLAAPGGLRIVWTLNRDTHLPMKSEIYESDTAKTTTAYENWNTHTHAPTRITISDSADPSAQLTFADRSFDRSRAEDFAPLVAGASDVTTADTVTVPFTLEANHIIVQVAVNGHAPMGFVLDTGAAYEVISTPRMADFGLTGYGSSQMTGGGNANASSFTKDVTLTLGGVTLANQHATVLDLNGLERAWGVPIGGILGYDFISRFVLDIDHQAKAMTMRRPDWTYAGQGVAVPLTFDGGIPYFEAIMSVPTKPELHAHMLMDFGASDTMILTSPFVAANDLARLAGTNSGVTGTAGLENQFFAQRNTRGRIDQIRLAELTLTGIPVSFSTNTTGAYASTTFAGTMGEAVYRRFHAIIDYPHRRVIFEHTSDSDAPFPDRKTFGATLIAGGPDLHTFTISGIRANSPAAAAGLLQNDIVAGVDTRAAAQISLSELRDMLAREGAHYMFHIRRGDQLVDVPATITTVSIDR